MLWTIVPHYMRVFLIHSGNSEFQNASASYRYTAAAVEFHMMRGNLDKFLVNLLKLVDSINKSSNDREVPHSNNFCSIHWLLRQTVNSRKVSAMIL